MRGGGTRASVAVLVVVITVLTSGCAGTGYLEPRESVTPTPLKVTGSGAEAGREAEKEPETEPAKQMPAFAPFADSLIGFVPGTADTSIRYLGRLSDGYCSDTLNVILYGDNRPGWRSRKLKPQAEAIESMVSWNPWHWVRGLVAIPVALVRGTIPDFVLWRELPDLIAGTPKDGREEQVNQATMATIDSLATKNQHVAAVINSGDLVKDGRRPDHWQRFLDITRPLYSRVPYMPVAGNHERTESPEGLANWHTATGLPIRSDRLYYCFDSADGWVRFVALDSNPLTDPKDYWPREFEVEYAKEQMEWLEDRLHEHAGPAIVFLHHPPFSLGFHRVEWQSDDMLRFRRAELVRVLSQSKLSVLVSGHEHAYERALMNCGDAVIISLVTGGAGSPLHEIPTGEEAARLFSDYGEIAGCEFQPQDVFASEVFHFIHLRIWFGGGQFFTWAVDENGQRQLIDDVAIDLGRYGIPKIDQHKMPMPSEKREEQLPPTEETPKGAEEVQKKAAEEGSGASAPAGEDR